MELLESKAQDTAEKFEVEVKIDGMDMEMVPFVQDFIARTVLGMLSSLKGYEPGCETVVAIHKV